MRILQLRNATLVLSLGPRHLLVDPMLGAPGSFPGFKLFGGGRRANPLVALPAVAEGALQAVTDVLVTHEHPDHLDRPALAWIQQRDLPVWAAPVDVPHLRRRGLRASPLADGALGWTVELVPGRHGRGLLGWLMGPVGGCYLACPGEPSVYLTGDTVLTPGVLEALDRLAPDVVVAPAGAANFGAFGDLLFPVEQLLELVRRAPGTVVLNHLEALDHCPTTRGALRARLSAEGLAGRTRVPEDGEELVLERPDPSPATVRRAQPLRPGLQKWVTGWFAR